GWRWVWSTLVGCRISTGGCGIGFNRGRTGIILRCGVIGSGGTFFCQLGYRGRFLSDALVACSGESIDEYLHGARVYGPKAVSRAIMLIVVIKTGRLLVQRECVWTCHNCALAVHETATIIVFSPVQTTSP